MEELRKKARRRRKELGLTQDEVAERVGVSVRTYQYFEDGTTKKPHEDTLEAIIRVLDLEDEQQAVVEETRSDWPADVQVYLNMIGAYLMTLEDDDRATFMREQTRRIFQRHAH